MPLSVFGHVGGITVQAANQGEISSQPVIRSGTLDWRSSIVLPHVKVDLDCLGHGVSEIFRVGVKQINVRYRTRVQIYNNQKPVPVINTLGQQSVRLTTLFLTNVKIQNYVEIVQK